MYPLIITFVLCTIIAGSLIGGGLRQHLVHHQVEEAITQEGGNEFCSFGYLKFDTEFGPIEGPFQSCHNSRRIVLGTVLGVADGEHRTGQ